MPVYVNHENIYLIDIMKIGNASFEGLIFEQNLYVAITVDKKGDNSVRIVCFQNFFHSF